METELVRASDQTDQEELGRLFAEHNLMAVPVVDAENKMKGIVTIDDIVDVFEEEATEDIQKMGGSEVLGAPYLRVGLAGMIRKRAPWLTILFISEMFTTTAMGYFENEIAKAVVLAVFVPLIISSGGNAGSQASTLVIRAMALGEVQLRDWWRVAGREVVAGLLLGLILGTVGLIRVLLWQQWFNSYGPHAVLIALTIFTSLIGIVAWGTLTGALLPFILRACKVDPATASTPFVATLVDVTGLVIYFTTASVILRGTLL
jgi:magnesium transporter